MYGNMLYCDDVIKVELQSDKVQPIIDEMNSSCETFCDLIDDIVEANVEDNNNIASAFRKRFGDKRVNALKKILNTETSEE
jgi:Flp pilus assembly CpaF family ATPase